MQVVYDAITGQRLILNIANTSVQESIIHEVLREGITLKNVLYGVVAVLNARSIQVDFAD